MLLNSENRQSLINLYVNTWKLVWKRGFLHKKVCREGKEEARTKIQLLLWFLFLKFCSKHLAPKLIYGVSKRTRAASNISFLNNLFSLTLCNYGRFKKVILLITFAYFHEGIFNLTIYWRIWLVYYGSNTREGYFIIRYANIPWLMLSWFSNKTIYLK